MDPTKASGYEEDKSQKANEELMDWLLATKAESEAFRKMLEARAARNMRLVKGMPVEEKNEVSNVRKRRKMQFRKIWSSGYRILASLFQAFLQDPETVRYEGRDEDTDPYAAKVLQKMVEYYRDRMRNIRDLFLQTMWCFQDIINIGSCAGKLFWRYNEERNIDEPVFRAYPLEQVFFDWSAYLPNEMQYAYFENYMTKEMMEDEGFDKTAIEKAVVCKVPVSELRAVRYYNAQDPLRKEVIDTEYPKPGTGTEAVKENILQRYKVVECFYRRHGKVFFCVLNPEGRAWLKKPMLSVYGDDIPAVHGFMLLEAHKLTPEGLPEPLEGPQESVNHTINVRKDNVELAMKMRPVVERGMNVDLQSLMNHRSGGPIMTDDMNAIRFERPPDVTQSSYTEVASDLGIIDEMSGVTAGKRGQDESQKATVAQINLSEGNAKIDLFIATVGETFIRRFYYLLGKHVQKFATDEKVFRVCNEKIQREDPKMAGKQFVYDIDFDADVIVEVGAGTVGRQLQLNQGMMFLDKAIQSNNITVLMLKNGVIPQEQAEIINVAKILLDMAPKIGYKNAKEYVIKVNPPQQQQPAPGANTTQNAEGANAPQPNAQGGDDLSGVINQITGGAQ